MRAVVVVESSLKAAPVAGERRERVGSDERTRSRNKKAKAEKEKETEARQVTTRKREKQAMAATEKYQARNRSAHNPLDMSLVGNFFWNASGGRIFRTDVERGKGRAGRAGVKLPNGERRRCRRPIGRIPLSRRGNNETQAANGAARATRERSICRSPGWRADCASATSDPG